MRFVLGLLLSALIGYVGYRRQSLSPSGVLGAILVGTTIFGLGGWAWGTLVVVFFVSSSALSHFNRLRKESLAEKFSKGSRRDLVQTLANGGAGALIAVGHAAWLHPLWWWAFVGTMATVNADTWATELGVLSKAQPRLVTTGEAVEVGTSGGVSLAGTQAALAGAALIGLAAAVFEFVPGQSLAELFLLFLSASFSGVAGALVDSFLGATVQSIYFCDHCRKETERYPSHRCGNLTRPIRGWRWLDNDGVNFLSSVAGGAAAAGVWLWLH